MAGRDEQIDMSTGIQITIDCADPKRMVEFWATALHYVPEPPPGGFASWPAYWMSIGVPEEEVAGVEGSESLVDPDGKGPRIWFQAVPEPKTVKNRVHLDLDVAGGRTVPVDVRKERVEAEAQRLISAGATRLRVLTLQDHYATVMQDPEGNEFCLH